MALRFFRASLILLMLLGLVPERAAHADPPVKYCLYFERPSEEPVGEGGDATVYPSYIDVWSGKLANPAPEPAQPPPSTEPQMLRYWPSPDNRYAVTYFDNGQLVLDDHTTGSRTILEAHLVPVWDFHWLDGGKRYVYIGGDPLAMITADRDDTNERRLISIPKNADLDVHNIPSWSPADDYGHIAYITQDERKIVVLSTITAAIEQVITGQFVQNTPQWTPVGDRFAVFQYEDEPPEDTQAPRTVSLLLISIKGEKPQTISLTRSAPPFTPFQIGNMSIQWSPDERYIALEIINPANTGRKTDIYDTLGGEPFPVDSAGVWASDSRAFRYFMYTYDEAGLYSYQLATRRSVLVMNHLNQDLINATYTVNHALAVWPDPGGYNAVLMDSSGENRIALVSGADTLPKIYLVSDFRVKVLDWTKAHAAYLTWINVDTGIVQTIDLHALRIGPVFPEFNSNRITYVAHHADGDTLDVLDVSTGKISQVGDKMVEIGPLDIAKYLNYVYFRWKTADGSTEIDVYNTLTGIRLQRFSVPESRAGEARIYFSPDEQHLVLVGGDPGAQYVAVGTIGAKSNRITRRHVDEVREPSWSPDNKLFLYWYTLNHQPYVDVITADGTWVHTFIMALNVRSADWAACY